MGDCVMKQRILNILIALDQFIFSLITLGGSEPMETISAAMWRLETHGKLVGMIMRPTIDTLFWFDPDHCQVSYENTKKHIYLPEEER
jgi:hypothetical protein